MVYHVLDAVRGLRCGLDCLQISILLTILGYIPGLLYAVYIVVKS